MKIYLAGPFTDGARATLRQRRQQLRDAGFDVDCEWLDARMPEYIGAPVDAADVNASDIVVVCADLGPSTAGGMWVEMGMSIQAGKAVYIVAGSEKLPLFKHLCAVWGDWPSLLAHLGGAYR